MQIFRILKEISSWKYAYNKNEPLLWNFHKNEITFLVIMLRETDKQWEQAN